MHNDDDIISWNLNTSASDPPHAVYSAESHDATYIQDKPAHNSRLFQGSPLETVE